MMELILVTVTNVTITQKEIKFCYNTSKKKINGCKSPIFYILYLPFSFQRIRNNKYATIILTHMAFSTIATVNLCQNYQLLWYYNIEGRAQRQVHHRKSVARSSLGLHLQNGNVREVFSQVLLMRTHLFSSLLSSPSTRVQIL